MTETVQRTQRIVVNSAIQHIEVDSLLQKVIVSPAMRGVNVINAGPIGPKGPAGDASTVPGPEGPEGPEGPQGVKGDTGAQGPQGAKGDTGATGAQGPQGVKGDTGATGAQGPQGVKGDTGVQGPAGADSTVPGPPGVPGEDGDQWYVSGQNGLNDPIDVPDPNLGDLFLYTSSGDVFRYIGPNNDWAGWEYSGSIIGPPGPEGPVGPVGPQGAEGWKAPVVAATRSSIVLSGLQVIDYCPVVEGDRVLVKNQYPTLENGIYIASAGDWQRAEDFITDSQMWGAVIPVGYRYGNVSGPSLWMVTMPHINESSTYGIDFGRLTPKRSNYLDLYDSTLVVAKEHERNWIRCLVADTVITLSDDPELRYGDNYHTENDFEVSFYRPYDHTVTFVPGPNAYINSPNNARTIAHVNGVVTARRDPGGWVLFGDVFDTSASSGSGASSGPEVDMPAPAAGLRYFATDTLRDWLSDGIGWIIMAEPSNPHGSVPIPYWGSTWVLGPYTFDYTRSNGFLDWAATLQIVTNGDADTNIRWGMPFPATAPWVSIGTGRENWINGKTLTVITEQGDAGTMAIQAYDNSWPGGDGAVLSMIGRYEMASRYSSIATQRPSDSSNQDV